MFLNFTNHPADTWSADQRRAAQQYGPVADMPFPDVPPALADVWAARILALHPACVLCQGEMTLTFRLVRLLQAQGVAVVAACSERRTLCLTDADGCTRRTSEFRFVRFRAYP